MIKVLPLFYKLTNIKGKRSKKIKEGITNINYKIFTDEGVFVMRIPRDEMIGINYENQEKVLSLVKDINVNVIYYNPINGMLITKYIDIQKREQVPFDVAIKHLKKLHSLDCKNIDIFDPFKLINEYKEVLKESIFIKEEKVIEKAKKVYEKYPLVLCHNDLLYANFLIDKEQKEYLIDFEYAGRNIALFDIVSFLSENNINDIASQVKFITKYYDKLDTSLLDDINTMFMFLDLLWGYWAYTMHCLYGDKTFLYIASEKHKQYNIRTYNL